MTKDSAFDVNILSKIIDHEFKNKSVDLFKRIPTNIYFDYF